MSDLYGKVALVTGGSGGIGRCICRQLAERGAEVVIIGRDKDTGQRVVDDTIRRTGNDKVSFESVDVSSYSNVKQFADKWKESKKSLHMLICAAVVAPRKREVTEKGIEMQFATNVLGYFWTTITFASVLKRSAPSRVVFTSSYWAGNLNFDDLLFENRRMYNNDDAYRQSKQAGRMLAVIFAEKFLRFGVTVNVCHTADVRTKLSADLGFGGSESGDQGADSAVWLATSDVGAINTGCYYEHRVKRECTFKNREETVRLWNVCVDMSPEIDINEDLKELD